MNYTNQTAFDEVMVRLMNQGCCAGEGDVCWYRQGKNKCAIGWLIPDDMYKPKMENNSAAMLVQKFSSMQALFADCDEDFLLELQEVHDDLVDQVLSPDEWRNTFLDSMNDLATNWDLDPANWF